MPPTWDTLTAMRGGLGVGGHGGSMSDTSQGPGWWLASDGKWYAPQPVAAPPPVGVAPPPMGMDAPQGPGWYQAADGKFYPPQPMMAGLPPIKKKFYKRVWFWLLIVVVVMFGGCGAILAAGTVAVIHAAKANHTVVYSVTGTGQASITYATLQQGSGQNGESQVTNVPLPWTKTITVSGLITAFSVTANAGPSGGSVTCTISEDGNQLSTNTASGAFATTSCSSAGKP